MQPTYDQTDPTSPAGSIPHWIDPVIDAVAVWRASEEACGRR